MRIEGTKDTPEISFDEQLNLITIVGSSFSERAISLYYIVIDWLKEKKYVENETVVVNFDFNYINSSTKKMVFALLNIINNLSLEGKNLKIIWEYEDFDEDMLVLGQDFSLMVSTPFEFKMKSSS